MEGNRANQYWMALGVTVGAMTLVVASLIHWGGSMPELDAISADSGPILDFVAPEKVQRWFDPDVLAQLAVGTNVVNPFFTTHFQPPPKPKPKPPPTTRTATLLFQGSVRTSQERLLAYILVEDKLSILTNGATVIADHVIAGLTARQVILTNALGETNVLTFRAPTTVTVPAGK